MSGEGAKKACTIEIHLVYFQTLINNIAELCKGSTPVSGTVCLGSNPSSAATETVLRDNLKAVSFLSFTENENKRKGNVDKR